MDDGWLLELPWLGHWALLHVSFTFLQHSSHIFMGEAGIQEEASPVTKWEARTSKTYACDMLAINI